MKKDTEIVKHLRDSNMGTWDNLTKKQKEHEIKSYKLLLKAIGKRSNS